MVSRVVHRGSRLGPCAHADGDAIVKASDGGRQIGAGRDHLNGADSLPSDLRDTAPMPRVAKVVYDERAEICFVDSLRLSVSAPSCYRL